MKTISHTMIVLGIAAALGAASPAFAESAPVYDADSLPQQYESAADQGPDLPPPPAPGQETRGAFVPGEDVDGGSAAAVPLTPTNTATMPLNQRLRRVEQQIETMQTNDSASRVEALQTQVQTLTNQVEQLTHQLQQVQTQQKSMYTDLDKRLQQAPAPVIASTVAANVDIAASSTKNGRKLSSPKPTAAVASVQVAAKEPAADQPNVAEEQQTYQTAYNLIKSKKYNEAVKALQNMLQKYPSGQFASNAHYWLGELFSLMNKNDQALNEFNMVVKAFPGSPRVSDAQLKVGLLLASQFNWSDAKASFKKVINHYPGTASARIASEQLKQIKQAGH